MNVFVLCTGRCGSLTFHRASTHIGNFTSGHETRLRMIGTERFAYPSDHIEVDNRLSWQLGRLDQKFGDAAYYVHLIRDPETVARSFDQRWSIQGSIISAYRDSILLGAPGDRLSVCRDYIDCITANIEHFLRDKTNKMTFHVESAEEDTSRFWDWIGASGDLAAAKREWTIMHNRTSPPQSL